MILTGYIAKWNSYPQEEIKVRVARPHILSPSKELLHDWKNNLITWEEYTERFQLEIKSNPMAVNELIRLAYLSDERDVRLICYEKNPPCHRFILEEMINNFFLTKAWIKKLGMF